MKILRQIAGSRLRKRRLFGENRPCLPPILLLCLLLMMGSTLSACGKNDKADSQTPDSPDTEQGTTDEQIPPPEEEEGVTIPKLIAANNTEALLRRHRSILNRNTLAEGFGGGYLSMYSGQDFYYESYLTEEEAADSPDTYLAYLATATEDAYYITTENPGEKRLCLVFHAMPEEEIHHLQPGDVSIVADPAVMSLAAITETVEQPEDGSIQITLYTDHDHLLALAGSLPEGMEGAALITRYEADAETLEIRSQTDSLVLPDGTEIPITALTVAMDAEEPVWASEMRALMAEPRIRDAEQPRTVTVIYNPGTEAEESYSMQADPKFRIFPQIREGYDLYSDRECTEFFTGLDRGETMILYARPAEEQAEH